MIFSDNIHLIADTIAELHDFASKVGMPRSSFRGKAKHHPHYDLINKKTKLGVRNRDGIEYRRIAKDMGAQIVTTREIIAIFQKKKIYCTPPRVESVTPKKNNISVIKMKLQV